MDAAKRKARRRHSSCRLNDIHDSLRRCRVAGKLLEESCNDSACDGGPCLAIKISKPNRPLMQRTNRQPVECEAGCELRENTVLIFSWIRMIPIGSAIAIFAMTGPGGAQVRGVYPLGMSATNPGVTPEAGFTYSNLFLFYSRSELKDANGAVTATGQNSVIMDMNSFIWVSNKKIRSLGGAIYSCVATLPIANNSLTSDADGPISGGGGFADSYYQPVI